MHDIVTYNAANFSKAFPLFHPNDDEPEDDNDIDDDTTTDVDRIDVINLGELLDEDDNTEDDSVVLPPLKRCGNHSLNLVASVDSKNAWGDKIFQRVYDEAMGKVLELSNAVSRSSN